MFVLESLQKGVCRLTGYFCVSQEEPRSLESVLEQPDGTIQELPVDQSDNSPAVGLIRQQDGFFAFRNAKDTALSNQFAIDTPSTVRRLSTILNKKNVESAALADAQQLAMEVLAAAEKWQLLDSSTYVPPEKHAPARELLKPLQDASFFLSSASISILERNDRFLVLGANHFLGTLSEIKGITTVDVKSDVAITDRKSLICSERGDLPVVSLSSLSNKALDGRKVVISGNTSSQRLRIEGSAVHVDASAAKQMFPDSKMFQAVASGSFMLVIDADSSSEFSRVSFDGISGNPVQDAKTLALVGVQHSATIIPHTFSSDISDSAAHHLFFFSGVDEVRDVVIKHEKNMRLRHLELPELTSASSLQPCGDSQDKPR